MTTPERRRYSTVYAVRSTMTTYGMIPQKYWIKNVLQKYEICTVSPVPYICTVNG
jgi:hypothetical protein